MKPRSLAHELFLATYELLREPAFASYDRVVTARPRP